jgi:hypothetical protein
MADKLITIDYKTTPATISIPNTLTKVKDTQLYTTKVPDTLRLNVVVTGAGEESVPTAGPFKRLREFLEIQEHLSKQVFAEKTSNSTIFDPAGIGFYQAPINLLVNTADTQTPSIQPLKLENVFTSQFAVKYFDKQQINNLVIVSEPRLTTGRPVFTSYTQQDLQDSTIYKQTNLLVVHQDIQSNLVDYKRLFVDFVDSTDDYLGETNLDDDQYATFSKTLATWLNAIHSVASITVFRPVVSPPRVMLDEKKITTRKQHPDILTTSTQTRLRPGKRPVELLKPVETFSKLFSTQRTSTSSGKIFDSAPAKQPYKVLNNNAVFDEITAKSVGSVLNTQYGFQDLIITSANYIRGFNTEFNTNTVASFVFDKINQSSLVSTDQKSAELGLINSSALLTSEILSRTINYVRSVSSFIHLTDDYLGEANLDDDQTTRFTKIVNNLVSSVDLRTVDLDTVYLSPVVVPTVKSKYFHKSLSDIVGIEDFFSSLNTPLFVIVNIASATTQGVANNQNYFSAAYVEPGYVGTNTYFS